MNCITRFSLLFVLLLSCSVYSYAQDECTHGSLVANEQKYEIGRFNECLSGLKPCMGPNGFSYKDKKQAFQLMAKCYLAMDSVDQADSAIAQLLTIDNNFQPGDRDPQRFRSEVNVIGNRMKATQITSVSKKSENIDLAPATVQIITAKDIQDRGYKTLDDIFSDLPGFDVSRTRGVVDAVLYQRGYRTSNTTDRTMILVDGVEDNDMWSNGDLINLQFPMSSIKRVEIIYGPASTIYGANAYAGVINIITKGESDLFGPKNKSNITANGMMGGGSFGTYYSNATVAARSRNTFFSATGGVYHSDEQDLSGYPAYNGIYDYSSSSYKTALTMTYSKTADSILNILDPNHVYHQTSGNSIIPTTYAITKADSLDKANYRKTYRGVDPGKFTNPKNDYYFSSKLIIGDFKIQLEYFDRNEGIAPDYNMKYNALNSALQNWQVRQGFASVKYDKKLSERLSVSSLSYYRISDRGKNAELTPYTSYVNGGFSANKGIPLDSLAKGVQPYFTSTYKSSQSNQFRTELRGLYTASDKIDFTGGVELRNGLLEGDYVNSPLQDPLANGYAHDSASYYSVTDLGIFLLGSYNNFYKKINVNIGGRLDNNVINNDYGYGSVFNPRVALIYYPGKFIFKSIYSEAFLDASPFNKFSSTSNRIPNPKLTPEKVKNLELCAKYNIQKKSSVEVAYYHSWYSNSLVTATVYGSNLTQFQGLGKADIQGVQFAGESAVFSFLSVYANATFTDPYAKNKNVEGKDSLTRMGDIATFSANAGVNIKLPWHFNLNTRLNYVSAKPTGKGTTTSGNPYNSTPEFTLLNATLGYSIKRVGIIQLRCDNICDVTYYSPGVRTASITYASRVPLPGRIFYAQFILNLNNENEHN